MDGGESRGKDTILFCFCWLTIQVQITRDTNHRGKERLHGGGVVTVLETEGYPQHDLAHICRNMIL